MRWLGLLVAAGCGFGPQALTQQLSEVQRTVTQAKKSGALKCAPIDVAMAESHSEFAFHDLEQGQLFNAQDEVRIARFHADQAAAKSPAKRCLDPDEGTSVLTDNDPIDDTVDQCPAEAEDMDGFRDEDGCPEFDNDSDGIRDTDDRCPNQAEDFDRTDDEDGCPDDDAAPKPPPTTPATDDIRVLETTIELPGPIQFSGARLRPSSRRMLDRLAAFLVEKPTLRIRIGAHTDSRGAERRNLRLSRQRAAAVAAYLVSRGVDKNRLTTVGYGETSPLADNRTKAGRERNRRVEFVIIGR